MQYRRWEVLQENAQWTWMGLSQYRKLIFSVKDQGEEPFFHEPVFGFLNCMKEIVCFRNIHLGPPALTMFLPSCQTQSLRSRSIILRMNSLFSGVFKALPGTSKGNLLLLNVGVGRSQITVEDHGKFSACLGENLHLHVYITSPGWKLPNQSHSLPQNPFL